MSTRLILLHGLNNNLTGFHPLADGLAAHGFDVHLMALPGHGDIREECRDFKRAFQRFDLEMRKLIQDPYVVVAFSTGAPYLQLWLEKNVTPKPLSQVLLAPALFPTDQKTFEKLARILPSGFYLPARTPKALRRYKGLYIWEYKTLFECIRTFQKQRTPFRIPTLTMVDTKDELIGHEVLKRELEARNPMGIELQIMERPYLRGRMPGKYHVLFNPDYFQKDWNEFVRTIAEHLKKHL